MEADYNSFATDARRQQDGLLAVTEVRARLAEDRCHQRRWNQITREIPIVDAMDIGILGWGQPPERRPRPRRLFSPLRDRYGIRKRLYGIRKEPEKEGPSIFSRSRSHPVQAEKPEYPDGPPIDEYFLRSGRTRWNSFPVNDERWLWCAYLGVSIVAVIVFLLLLVKTLCSGSYGSCLLSAAQLGLVVVVYIVGAVFAGNQLSVDVLLLIGGMIVAAAAGHGLGFGG
ncbi:hypothetical protein MGG_15135 [Pyricularia oryzae 70-15]|uniref:Uncharacterized protein n=1 Tax=Pyricularia oryzae (strain 70-15 / ATCC MYA-4617 / FGSC 8958) TaxID=242507 RepID=G4N4T0_PYRO7|nr:uncharacterized protein MGG_15135 [Pyricularia oryzae 70-15]EHA52895.1 hypothetical protein MGG_15135 [Pyricularia oryzae 70-15]